MPKATNDDERTLWEFLSAARLLAQADAGRVPLREAEIHADAAVKSLAAQMRPQR